MAVNLDEAWGIPSEPLLTMVMPVPSAPAPRPPLPPPPPPTRRARRHGAEGEASSEMAASSSALRELTEEVRKLRAEQQRTAQRTTVGLCITVVTVLLLLVALLQAHNRLNYTTECLLWMLRARSRGSVCLVRSSTSSTPPPGWRVSAHEPRYRHDAFFAHSPQIFELVVLRPQNVVDERGSEAMEPIGWFRALGAPRPEGGDEAREEEAILVE
eukprot:scaffold40520_cov26-Tisochrysis_lutea.AAC.1